MIKSLSGRIYVGAALAFLTVPVVVLLYLDAFRRHDSLFRQVTKTGEIAEHVASVQQQLTDWTDLRRAETTTVVGTKSPPSSLLAPAVLITLREMKTLMVFDTAQLHQLATIDQLTATLMAGDMSQLPDIRRRLAQIKEGAIHELLVRRQTEGETDYWQKNAMWGTFFVAVSSIGILIMVIFDEFRKRRRAERELKGNLATLQNYNQESNERNWQLTGLSTISLSLQGKDQSDEMAQSLVTALITYLEIPAGALYLYQPAGRYLDRVASVSLPADAPTSYELNDGLVGEAAMGRNMMIINHVPEEYWRLQSGVGATRPGQVVLIPLWHRKERIGVLELASFRVLEPPALSLLQRLTEPIAVAIHSAQTNERVRILLDQVQQQNEMVAAQKKELLKSNEALMRQADSLQASEEELKVQEEELRQMNAELMEKNETINVARQVLAIKAEELEATSQYKSSFLANMSHELRTPLNSVLILAKLLADNKTTNLTTKQVEYANIIHKSGHDLLTLINDILDLSKIEAGHIDLQLEPVSVNSILRDVTQLFAVVAEEKNVTFVTNRAEPVPASITTDKQRLGQIIKNLLSNAFKFTPRQGSVTLTISCTDDVTSLTRESLREQSDVLAIAVTDTGVGIPEDKQQLIFEAFQQADGSTSRQYGGTGLGLSISRELIKRLGGEIRVESQEGQGSTFTIYLPLSTPATSAGEPAARPAKPQAQRPKPVKKQPVATLPVLQTAVEDDRNDLQKGDQVMLIVEDDAQFASIVRDVARAKGYKTLVALQGDEGLHYARQHKPSAIILDLQLPVLDGISLLQRLKDDPALLHIPVHILSAGDEPRLAVAGAMAYLKKPVEQKDLEDAFTRISTLLAERVKNVLVLSGDHLTDNSLTQLIADRHFDITCDYATLTDEALHKVRERAYDCVIADIGTDVTKGVAQLQQLQAISQSDQLPVIIYLDNDLSTLDELQLRKVSDTIIRNSGHAKDRLMDELDLFLYKVQTGTDAPVRSFTPNSYDGSTPANWQDKTVLLVDDDMRNVFSLSTLLEEHQLTVITASDGMEAIDAVNQHPQVSVVLMDMMMPVMDGYEATRRIRADPRFAKLPIIALTAKAMAGDRAQCIQAGASDYITKPVDTQQLLSVMRVWMQP